MNGIWILLLLILSALLPLIIVFFRFKAGKIQITLPWFLAAIVAGIVSLLAAALIQSLFPHPAKDGLGQLLFGVFIRIAMAEEASRLLILFPLLRAGNRLKNSEMAFCAAIGLVAGLGFAAAENASYGMADINITLLRLFTAAPLHGACGLRAGAAVFLAGRNLSRSVFLFGSSVIIHGAYNLMILSPALPSLLSVAIALIALIISLPLLNAAAGENTDILSGSAQ